VQETSLEKLKRTFAFFPSQTFPPSLPPVFYISREQEAHAEQTDRMHGFPVEGLTQEHIILSVENPELKSLYEVSLFSKKIRNFFKKKYILAKDKKEALSFFLPYKASFQVRVKKAKKMDCYPIISVTSNRIVLKRER
ncbi:hypothetical protein H5U35_07055, partial [Candidatus Aerophobetes bacterium]|nr:hypothetical protein [Candidatus Aerophobetes bacterium]